MSKQLQCVKCNIKLPDHCLHAACRDCRIKINDIIFKNFDAQLREELTQEEYDRAFEYMKGTEDDEK